MGEKVYKPVVKEGDHLIRSKENPDRVRGLTRDSDNKNPDIIEWEEYDLDDLQTDNSISDQDYNYHLTPEQEEEVAQLAAAVVELILVGGIWLFNRVVIPWWKSTAWPWLCDRGQDIIGFFSSEKKQALPTHDESQSAATALSTPDQSIPAEYVQVTAQIDKAFEQMQFDLTEEEAQEHFMRLIYHMLGMANEIRILSNAAIVKKTDSEQERIEKQREAEIYLTERVAHNIDKLLSAGSIKLDLDTARELYALTGGGVSLNGEYVPVQPSKINEALHKMKREEV